jgi:hypothetical protein
MKVIQNVAIQPQQMIVENLIDLDQAKKPNEKFVEFIGDDYKKNPPGFEYPYDVQFKNTGMNQFRSSSLECDDLTNEERMKSLRRMLICLEKHVDHQIELELISKKRELKEKYDKMYGISKLLEKILKQDS